MQKLALILMMVVACTDEHALRGVRTPIDRDMERWTAKMAGARTAREDAIGPLATRCCDEVDADACEMLFAALHREPDLMPLVIHARSPHCQASIPVPLVLEGCPDDACGRSDLRAWMAGVELTPASLAVFYDDWPSLALAYLGEDELRPAIDALADPRKWTRRRAATILGSAAIYGPLHMPDALAVLDEMAATDPDHVTRDFAAIAAEKYRASQLVTSNDAVIRILADGISYDEIHMLGVRRFSCDAVSAVPILRELANGWQPPNEKLPFDAIPNPQLAIAAKQALRLRAKRCARS